MCDDKFCPGVSIQKEDEGNEDPADVGEDVIGKKIQVNGYR